MRAIAAIALCLASVAHADPTPSDTTEADRLFGEGRALLAAGKTDEACHKFEQSIAKDPRAVGTLLNLALCNERRGKVATALQLFQEAFDRATEANLPGQRQAAQQEIAALRAQVPILAIAFAASPVAGEKLLIDDAVIATDRSELPIDPGPHTIVLTAPGRLPYQTTLAIKVSERRVLTLPALEVPRPASARPTVALISTWSGVTLLGIAAGMATYAIIDYRAQFPTHCGGDRPDIGGAKACDAHGAAHTDTDRTLGTAASIVAGVGATALAVGLYLKMTAPNERATVTPTGTSTSVGLAVTGRF